MPLVDIRGLRTRNVLLLLDGIPLNSSFDGLFDPATLSVENIARIKLTRGASSMLYGPGGNAGVLNIITRAAAAAKTASTPPDVAVRVEAGASGSRDVRARANWRGGPVGLVATGSFFDQSSFQLSDGFAPTGLEDGGRRLNSDRRDASAFASATVDSTPTTRWGFNLGYRDSERGKPPVTEEARLSAFAPRARFERADQQAVSAHAALSRRVGDSWTLRPSLFFNRTDETTDAFDDARFATQAQVGALHEEAVSSTGGAALQIERRRGASGLLTLALDLRRERWEADGFEITAAGGGGAGGGGGGGGGGAWSAVTRIDDERSVEQSSLAIEYELSPGGPWSAVVGAGYAAQGREGSSDGDFSFLLGGSYALGPGLALRGSVARRIRFPTLRDLYGADRGNPELEAERTRDYEIAVERQIGAGAERLELAFFRIEADDFIERVPNDVLRNAQATRFRGAELSGGHRITAGGLLRWSYTYLDSKNLSAAGGSDKTQNRPEHKVSLVAEHITGGGWRLRGDVLFVADSYALSRSRPAQAMELGDYTVAGASVTYLLPRDRVRVIGRVTNLLDKSYQESIGFPAPGREIFLALELGPRRDR